MLFIGNFHAPKDQILTEQIQKRREGATMSREEKGAQTEKWKRGSGGRRERASRVRQQLWEKCKENNWLWRSLYQ